MRDTEVIVCGRRYRAVAAESFLDALLGVHGVANGVEAIVIRGSSVHGFTLRTPMWVFGLSEAGDGLGGRVLHPWRIVRFPGASRVVEIVTGLACDEEHRSHTVHWSG